MDCKACGHSGDNFIEIFLADRYGNRNYDTCIWNPKKYVPGESNSDYAESRKPKRIDLYACHKCGNVTMDIKK